MDEAQDPTSQKNYIICFFLNYKMKAATAKALYLLIYYSSLIIAFSSLSLSKPAKRRVQSC